MTEETYDVNSGGLFDPDNFVTKTALAGKRAPIIEAIAIRHNYGGKIAEEVTAVRIKVRGLKQPMLIAAGDTHPATKIDESKPATQDNLQKALVGPFLIGKIEKRSNIAAFVKEAKAAGFPMAELGANGFSGFDGADVTWKALEKIINKEAKGYDVISEYHGKVDVSEDLAGNGPASADPTASPAPPVPSVDAGLLAEVQFALRQALQEAPNQEISRGQLSSVVGKKFADPQKRTKALVLLLKNDTLTSVDGVTFDGKTVKLSGVPAPTASETPAGE